MKAKSIFRLSNYYSSSKLRYFVTRKIRRENSNANLDNRTEFPRHSDQITVPYQNFSELFKFRQIRMWNIKISLNGRGHVPTSDFLPLIFSWEHKLKSLTNKGIQGNKGTLIDWNESLRYFSGITVEDRLMTLSECKSVKSRSFTNEVGPFSQYGKRFPV